MREYGYSIEHILMVDIIPDASVRKAMNEINAGTIFFDSVPDFSLLDIVSACNSVGKHILWELVYCRTGSFG